MEDNVAKKDQFSKHLEFEIVQVSSGYAQVKTKVKPYFLNGVEIVHGGVIFSLADYAFALASNTTNETGVAINAHIQFIKPACLGDELQAESKMISRSRRLGTFLGCVMNQKKDILAQFQAMAYFKNPK